MHISLETVKALIRQELDLANLPVGETFFNLGFEPWQMERVRSRIANALGKNIMPLRSDTLLSYTDKLLKDNTLPTPQRVIESAKQDPLI